MRRQRFASGKRSFAICDRCGQRYPYLEIKREPRTGSRVCRFCYDPTHPQEEPIHVEADAQALRHPRPDRVEPPVTQVDFDEES